MDVLAVVTGYTYCTQLLPLYAKQGFENGLADLFDGLQIYGIVELIAIATATHCMFSYIYMLQARVDANNISNETLLNNLEEGIFIVEKDCSSICFLNTAAKNFISNPAFDVSKTSKVEEVSSQQDASFDLSKKIFAFMDKGIFSRAHNVDA